MLNNSKKLEGRCIMSFFSSQNSMYLFGGNTNHGSLNDFHRFNAKEKTWLIISYYTSMEIAFDFNARIPSSA